MARILYLTYDGLLEPLGHSQVFQYLRHLSGRHRIFLVSYEKRGDWEDAERRERLREEVRQSGIRWLPLRYHAKPSALATAYDICAGFSLGLYLVLRHRIGIVHARSYVASVPALLLKRLLGVRFIFDMRGFWADERAERAGLPKSSPLYRAAKWFERRFFENADTVVSLTRVGAGVVRELPYLRGKGPQIEVIPTCTDLERFRLEGKGSRERFTLGYVGSADTAYLFEPVLETFKILRRHREARLKVLTRTPHGYLHELLRRHQISEEDVEIGSVPPARVATEMAGMDAGIFFVKPGFSTCASVPTKLGEFLACGVPCLGNAGVGDLESILEGESVGVILREFSGEAQERAVQRLLEIADHPGIRERCAGVASRYFSLTQGAESYHRIYSALRRGEA